MSREGCTIATPASPFRCTTVTLERQNALVLPFTREIPARQWLGFVHEEDSRGSSVLMSRVLPSLAVAGVVLLVVSGGKQHHEPEAPPASSAAAARAKVASVAGAGAGQSADPPSEPAPAKPESAPAEPEPPEAPDTAAPAATPAAPPTPAAEPPPEPKPEPKPEPTPEPKPKKVREPKPLSPAAARRATRAAAGLRGAVASGQVKRSRENFAVTTAGGDEMGWDEAKATCSSLSVDGVGGWKLPSRGDAREIHRGNAATRGAYWTRQRGPHDDTIYVYDPRTRRSSPWLDQEIASVVCVQPRPR